MSVDLLLKFYFLGRDHESKFISNKIILNMSNVVRRTKNGHTFSRSRLQELFSAGENSNTAFI